VEITKKTRLQVIVAATVSEIAATTVGVAAPALVVFRTDKEGVKTVWNNPPMETMTGEELGKWADTSSRAPVSEYSWGVRSSLDNLKLATGQIFIDDDSFPKDGVEAAIQAAIQPYEEVAKKFAGKLAFLYMKKSIASHYLNDVFPRPHKYPSFVVAESFAHNALQYGLDTEEPLTPAMVEAHVNKFLAGELTPSRKSEPSLEGAFSPGRLFRMVWRRLATMDFEEGSPDLLLALYKTWGPNHHKDLQMMERVARATTPVKSLVVASMDTALNYFPTEMFEGLDPNAIELTVYLVKGGAGTKQVAQLVPSESQGKILSFLHTHSGEMAKAEVWEAVKAEVKQMNAEVRVAKEKAAQEAKEEAERLLTIEKQDLSGDGGVIKQVLREGSGEVTHKAGDLITAHYTGMLLDGTKFDSSRDRGESFDFKMGQGHVIKCWDMAFATMRVGERAMITCAPEYAYGDVGSSPKIPPKAHLRFDAELIGVTPEPDRAPADPSKGGDRVIEVESPSAADAEREEL